MNKRKKTLEKLGSKLENAKSSHLKRTIGDRMDKVAHGKTIEK